MCARAAPASTTACWQPPRRCAVITQHLFQLPDGGHAHHCQWRPAAYALLPPRAATAKQ
jgi:hypothetical protein